MIISLKIQSPKTARTHETEDFLQYSPRHQVAIEPSKYPIHNSTNLSEMSLNTSNNVSGGPELPSIKGKDAKGIVEEIIRVAEQYEEWTKENNEKIRKYLKGSDKFQIERHLKNLRGRLDFTSDDQEALSIQMTAAMFDKVVGQDDWKRLLDEAAQLFNDVEQSPKDDQYNDHFGMLDLLRGLIEEHPIVIQVLYKNIDVFKSTLDPLWESNRLLEHRVGKLIEDQWSLKERVFALFQEDVDELFASEFEKYKQGTEIELENVVEASKQAASRSIEEIEASNMAKLRETLEDFKSCWEEELTSLNDTNEELYEMNDLLQEKEKKQEELNSAMEVDIERLEDRLIRESSRAMEAADNAAKMLDGIFDEKRAMELDRDNKAAELERKDLELRNLQAELKSLKIFSDNQGSQISAFQQESIERGTELKKLNAQLSREKNETKQDIFELVSSHGAKIERLTKEIQDQGVSHQDLQKALVASEDLVDQLRQRLSDSETAQGALTAQLTFTKAQLEDTTDEVQRSLATEKALQDQLRFMQENNDRQEAAAQEVKEQLASYETLLARSSADLETARTEHSQELNSVKSNKLTLEDAYEKEKAQFLQELQLSQNRYKDLEASSVTQLKTAVTKYQKAKSKSEKDLNLLAHACFKLYFTVPVAVFQATIQYFMHLMVKEQMPED